MCFSLLDKPRKRVTVGEIEKTFIVDAYNRCHGKDWREVLVFVRQIVVDANLPHHVVDLYLTQPDERLTNRMRRIVNEALRSSTGQASSSKVESTSQAETLSLLENKMQYAKKMSPTQRKKEAVKRKINSQFVDDSSSADEDRSTESQRKKGKTTAQQAQEAHKQMCEKAVTTMENVNQLLSKVDDYLKQNKK